MIVPIMDLAFVSLLCASFVLDSVIACSHHSHALLGGGDDEVPISGNYTMNDDDGEEPWWDERLLEVIGDGRRLAGPQKRGQKYKGFHRCGTGSPGQEEMRIVDSTHRKWLKSPEGRKSARSMDAIKVDTYVHVITDSNGRDGNVKDKAIKKQIKVLNKDFKGAKIRFNLKKIQRWANDDWHWNCENEPFKKEIYKGDSSDLYIYTCQQTDGFLGWAYLPWYYKRRPYLDGAVIYSESLPGGKAKPYNRGRTATHEVAHYFGVLHTFEGGCKKKGDLITDTSMEASAAFGCPKKRDTCTSDDLMDPIHNFMDYTDDSCMDHFTQEQAKFMQANWKKYRKCGTGKC